MSNSLRRNCRRTGEVGHVHQVEVVRRGQVASITLRVLIAVLTLVVASHPKRSKFDAHRVSSLVRVGLQHPVVPESASCPCLCHRFRRDDVRA